MVKSPGVEPSISGSVNKLLLMWQTAIYLITHLLATVSADIDVLVMSEKTESLIG